jgi:hypothetical protein
MIAHQPPLRQCVLPEDHRLFLAVANQSPVSDSLKPQIWVVCMWQNPERVQKTIKRLRKEIAEIDAAIYPTDEGDLAIMAGMLERKRDDVVRSTVLQLHTAIEDLLTQVILYAALGITDMRLKHRLSRERGKAFRRMLYDRDSLGFDMKLNFAVGLGLIPPRLRKQLMELNTIRNKCSHNWVLAQRVRRGRRPAQLKLPLLNFRGKDLHKVDAIKEFIGEYGLVYLHLYARLVR